MWQKLFSITTAFGLRIQYTSQKTVKSQNKLLHLPCTDVTGVEMGNQLIKVRETEVSNKDSVNPPVFQFIQIAVCCSHTHVIYNLNASALPFLVPKNTCSSSLIEGKPTAQQAELAFCSFGKDRQENLSCIICSLTWERYQSSSTSTYLKNVQFPVTVKQNHTFSYIRTKTWWHWDGKEKEKTRTC